MSLHHGYMPGMAYTAGEQFLDEMLTKKQRAVKAAHLTIDAETLMNKAASVDGVDRQLAAGYRARALKMTQEAVELRRDPHPFNLKLK